MRNPAGAKGKKKPAPRTKTPKTKRKPKRKAVPKPIDPTKPLRNGKHEAYAQDCARAVTHIDAYLKQYPHCKAWKREAAHVAAAKLYGKIVVRVTWLQEKAADEAVGDLAARRRLLWETIEECKQGLRPYADGTPDGDLIFSVSRENLTFAIERIEQHILVRPGEGDGKNDSIVRKMMVRDYLPYLRELNKLDGIYPAEKRELSGPNGGPIETTTGVQIAETEEEWRAVRVAIEAVRKKAARRG